MKILILSNKFPYPLKDGGAIATFNLINGLANLENRLTLLTFNTKKHYFPTEKLPENVLKKIKIHTVYIDTDITLFSTLKNWLFSRKPYISERFFNNNFQKKLIQVLDNNSYDIIQIEGLYLLQYIPEIKKRTKAIISYRAHNIEHKIWLHLAENEKNILRKFYLKNFTKSGASKQTLFAYDKVKKKYFKSNPKDICHIRNFNKISFPGKEYIVETEQAKMESIIAISFKKIIKSNTYPDEEQLTHILSFISLISLRHPRMRGIFEFILDDFLFI
ncbi:MAG: DUF4238 domain-containing protein [Bacteroidales bacterium]|nr:DUF4238 domain-containing protein [Bacteroidales bacterium]